MIRLIAARLLILAVFSVLTLSCRRGSDLPELGTLGSFSFIDQKRQTVSADTLQGKVWVAAFMFTRCPTICPRITQRMRALQIEAKRQDIDVRLVSFSVDPEYDTPAILSDYARRYQVDASNWAFLTGDFEAVKRTAVDGFKLALDGASDAGAEHYGIVHGSHLILVDKALKIRGYYRTDDDERMAALLKDAAVLAR